MERSPRAWIAGICASLLCGIALLTIGLELHIVILVGVGALLAQFSPVAFGYLCRKAHRSSPGKAVTRAPGGGTRLS